MTTYRVQLFLTGSDGGFIASKMRTGQTDADVRQSRITLKDFVRKATKTGTGGHEFAEKVTRTPYGLAYRWTYTYTDRAGVRSVDTLRAIPEHADQGAPAAGRRYDAPRPSLLA